ncbi:MAG: hypothetical protein LC104_05035 [Bacteroidales bacterium]|nr:hypothetical protein [Bacteroidales bacterium]
MLRYFLLGTLVVAGLVLATATPAQAWGRGRPASTYIPGYGWTYPSSPALYGYAPYGYYADYGTYFRGVPRDGGVGGGAYPGASQNGYGFSNYGFGALSGTSGYPSIGYNGMYGEPSLPVGYGAGK